MVVVELGYFHRSNRPGYRRSTLSLLNVLCAVEVMAPESRIKGRQE